MPFLAFAALELNFLVAGLRERGSAPAKRGRLPQDERHRGARRRGVARAGARRGRRAGRLAARGRRERGGRRAAAAASAPRPAARPARRRRGRGGARLRPARAGSATAAGTGSTATTRRGPEALLSAEAGRIAGHEARVHCDARGEAVGIVQHADGIAEVGGRNAYLTPDICYRLYRLAFKDDEGAFSQTARAIAVLAHEAWHLRGETRRGSHELLRLPERRRARPSGWASRRERRPG